MVRDSSKNDKRHKLRNRNDDKVKECTLTNFKTIMETNRMMPPLLSPWAAVVHALDNNDHINDEKRQCITVRMYKQMVWSALLPCYREDDVDAVLLCF